MSQTIRSLPPVWAAVAYALLGLGVLFTFGFIARYVTNLPWSRTEEGRHLVAMSANVGAFFVLYSVLAVWPDFPGRNAIRMTLFVVLVANCGRRWWLLERYLRERRIYADRHPD